MHEYTIRQERIYMGDEDYCFFVPVTNDSAQNRSSREWTA